MLAENPLLDLLHCTRPVLEYLLPPERDNDLQRRVEKAFLKQRKYSLVASAFDADIVFVVEGLYLYRPRGARIADAGSFVVARPGEARKANLLVGCGAVAVPRAVYEKDPTDGAALLAARFWEGVAVVGGTSNPTTPPSPEDLVRQFHRAKNTESRDSPRLCAVSPLPNLSASPAAAPRRTQPVLKTTHAGAPPPAPADPPPGGGEPAFKIDVALVSVPVIATDAQGRFVSGLRDSNFKLFEDGVEQKIDRVLPAAAPFNVALMLDTSDSTRFTHGEIQHAALAFVRALRSEDRVMVVSFDLRVYLDSEFTGDQAQLRRAILQTRMGASTRLYDAVKLVVTERLAQIPERKAVVLLSDGVDSSSRLLGAPETLSIIQESNVLVYAIQYDSASRPAAAPQRVYYSKSVYAKATRYLEALTAESGGRIFRAKSLTSIDAAFSMIADELRQQYTICYYPSRPASDGSLRRIQVFVDVPEVKIRARKAYRALGPR